MTNQGRFGRGPNQHDVVRDELPLLTAAGIGFQKGNVAAGLVLPFPADGGRGFSEHLPGGALVVSILSVGDRGHENRAHYRLRRVSPRDAQVVAAAYLQQVESGERCGMSPRNLRARIARVLEDSGDMAGVEELRVLAAITTYLEAAEKAAVAVKPAPSTGMFAFLSRKKATDPGSEAAEALMAVALPPLAEAHGSKGAALKSLGLGSRAKAPEVAAAIAAGVAPTRTLRVLGAERGGAALVALTSEQTPPQARLTATEVKALQAVPVPPALPLKAFRKIEDAALQALRAGAGQMTADGLEVSPEAGAAWSKLIEVQRKTSRRSHQGEEVHYLMQGLADLIEDCESGHPRWRPDTATEESEIEAWVEGCFDRIRPA